MTAPPQPPRGPRWPAGLAWLAAFALIAALVARVSWTELRTAWGERATVGFVLWVVVLTALPLPFDAWATRRALARLGLAFGWRELMLARGASYLPGLLHFTAAQGGLLLYLVRRGTALPRATVALLFVAATQALGLLALAGFALLGGPPAPLAGAVAGSLAALGAGAAIYLVLVALGPARLGPIGRHRALAPLLAAGLGGHLAATAERLPHLLSLVVVSWGALAIWGIAVPLPTALALMPLVVLIGMVPVTPGGLGSVQLAQVLLFAPWAPGATLAERQADVLACGLTGHLLGLLAQAAIGLFCLARLPAAARRAP